ncbi:unnamed protein product [Symbiodinium sp. CCMP2592]|nr:unnamed protein product [Symbiodinium sp. CCMP2592]
MCRLGQGDQRRWDLTRAQTVAYKKSWHPQDKTSQSSADGQAYGCKERRMAMLLVPRRADSRFLRIPYERNGPFWALRDGREFLKPQRRGLVADPAVPGDTWAPGKYVVFVEALSHFYGVEVFADGETLMYTSCRRHEGQAVDPALLSRLRVDARYRVVHDDEGMRVSTRGSSIAAREEKARPSSTLNPAEDRRGGADDSDEELSGMFDEVSVEIFDEIERYGRDSKGVPALRLRPFLGYRAACASLYRTVTNHILPQQAGSPVELQKRTRDGEQRLRYVLKNDVLDANGQEDGEEKEAEVSDASKARALFVVLRQLVSNTAWAVERSAIKAEAGEGEWKQRTPDLETPDYEVLYRDALNGYEVREYAPYAVVRTAGQGGEAANNRSFFMLADYIFGKKNERNEKMAMTTPVQMDKSTGTMSFIMPSKYWGESLSEAPLPAEDAGVTLQERPGERVAVSIFGGYAVGSLVARKTEELLASVAESEEWELAENATRLLQYNDPFTVPWKRRNEVSVPVRQRA